MSPVLLDILLRSARGRAVRWLRLLKNPRYLVAFVAGMAYFGWIFLRPVMMGGSHGTGGGMLAAAGIHLHGLAALAMAVAFTLVWLLLPGRPALALSQADVEILMPAPVPRRDLVDYAMLKEQPAVLLGAVLLSGGRPLALLAAWGLLTLASLHVKGCTLTKARLAALPAARAWALRLAALAVLGLYWGVLVTALRHIWWLQVAHSDPTAAPVALAPALLRAFTAPGLPRILLGPFLLATAPLVTQPLALRLAGWATLLGLLVLHRSWVAGTQVRFEEATLERARRRAAARDPRARHARLAPAARDRHPFALAPGGRPEVAVFWKSVLQFTRQPVRRIVLAALIVLAAVALAVALAPDATVAGAIAGAAAAMIAMLAVFAPISVRADLRLDLTRLEVVRTWPVAPWRLVLADALVPATVGAAATAFAAALLVATDIGLRMAPGGGSAELPGGLLPPDISSLAHAPAPLVVPLAALAGLILLAGVTFLLAVVINLAVLLLPGWIPLGPDRARGPAAFGQAMLATAAMLLVLLVGVTPGTLLVGVCAAVQGLAGLPFSAWELPAAAVVAVLPLLAEAAVVVRLAGGRFARLDPSQEILAAQL